MLRPRILVRSTQFVGGALNVLLRYDPRVPHRSSTRSELLEIAMEAPRSASSCGKATLTSAMLVFAVLEEPGEH
jgi:hypothetical protein